MIRIIAIIVAIAMTIVLYSRDADNYYYYRTNGHILFFFGTFAGAPLPIPGPLTQKAVPTLLAIRRGMGVNPRGPPGPYVHAHVRTHVHTRALF